MMSVDVSTGIPLKAVVNEALEEALAAQDFELISPAEVDGYYAALMASPSREGDRLGDLLSMAFNVAEVDASTLDLFVELDRTRRLIEKRVDAGEFEPRFSESDDKELHQWLDGFQTGIEHSANDWSFITENPKNFGVARYVIDGKLRGSRSAPDKAQEEVTRAVSRLTGIWRTTPPQQALVKTKTDDDDDEPYRPRRGWQKATEKAHMSAADVIRLSQKRKRTKLRNMLALVGAGVGIALAASIMIAQIFFFNDTADDTDNAIAASRADQSSASDVSTPETPRDSPVIADNAAIAADDRSEAIAAEMERQMDLLRSELNTLLEQRQFDEGELARIDVLETALRDAEQVIEAQAGRLYELEAQVTALPPDAPENAAAFVAELPEQDELIDIPTTPERTDLIEVRPVAPEPSSASAPASPTPQELLRTIAAVGGITDEADIDALEAALDSGATAHDAVTSVTGRPVPTLVIAICRHFPENC